MKGRRLSVVVGRGVRPTSARVREAIFDVLGHDLTGLSLLDGTGGTGMLALEALSRGADDIVVLERAGEAARRIRQAVTGLPEAGRVRVLCVDALRWEVSEGAFDVVFLDPPYEQDLAPWVQRFWPVARRWLIVEHATRTRPPAAPEGLHRTRRYGDTSVTWYARSDAADPETTPGETAPNQDLGSDP